MTLAIRGDRGSSLSVRLGPGTWLLAVARGFGRIDGLSTESALLARLRAECERRMRSPRFRRAVDRPQTAATAVLALLARVNGALYACTASHEDYVTAAASLTAVVVVYGVAYVIHAGSTAAYLARGGDVTALCPDDTLFEQRVPLLARAFAAAPTLDVSVSNARLRAGDAIVLLGRRVGSENDVAALLERVQASDLGENVLVARFEEDATAIGERRHVARPHATLGAFVTRIAAAIGFLLATVFAR